MFTLNKFGGRGIRTPGTLSDADDFKSSALNQLGHPSKINENLL